MNQYRLLELLHSVHTSEKSSMVNQQSNQYIFKVARNATKKEVRQAVESMFSVSVIGVNLINVKGKPVVSQQSRGRRNHWKKACVRLAAGNQIDIVQATE